MPAPTKVHLADYIRDIPDFPKPGILFRDITPLLASPQAFGEAIQGLAEPFRQDRVELVAAAEARGFIFAAPLALALGAGLVPIRKPVWLHPAIIFMERRVMQCMGPLISLTMAAPFSPLTSSIPITKCCMPSRIQHLIIITLTALEPFLMLDLFYPAIDCMG